MGSARPRTRRPAGTRPTASSARRSHRRASSSRRCSSVRTSSATAANAVSRGPASFSAISRTRASISRAAASSAIATPTSSSRAISASAGCACAATAPPKRPGPQWPTGFSRAHAGIGFFDHMLEQLAKHGGFALDLACEGDLHIDEHHTVEDCALALGEALRRALGDKAGIARYGFLMPMDESRAQVALDLSGRPYAVFEGQFGRDQVGGLPTELVPHFFRSLAESLGAAIHVSVAGENTHHMIEACFKCVGRALRAAVRREGSDLPTTKGVL